MTAKSPYRNRDEAQAAGSRRFYTGKVCTRGHDSDRYTLNGGCIACLHRKVNAPANVAFNIAPVHLVFPTNTAPSADLVKRVQAWVNQALADGSLAAEMAERLPLIRTATAEQEVDTYRSWGWSDRQLLRGGYARVAALEPTEKCQGTPLAEFARNGWTDAQLIAQGYAVPA